MKPRSLLVLLAMITVAFSFSCKRDKRHLEHSAVAKAAKPLPEEGGTLVRRLVIDAGTLNPVRSGSAQDRHVHKYLYTPLLYLDRNLQPVAGLAYEWTMAADGLVYSFHLNEKATFSDGSPVRATDVLFTLRKIVDPKTEAPQVAGFFEELDLTRTRVLSEHVIEVAFRRPMAHQLVHFADIFVLPEHVYAEGDFNDDFNDVAVGSGPYRLVKRERGKEIILRRRTDYWRESPRIETIHFKVITDHGTAWNALKLGEIDETILSSDTWLRESKNPSFNRKIAFRRFYRLNYNFIAWNNRRALLSDRRVRSALAMCVPVDALIRDLFHGTGRRINGPFTPDEYAFNPAVAPVGFDPAAAKNLLATAGWIDRDGDGVLDKNGKPFAMQMLILPGSASTMQFAQTVQAELKRIGIQLAIDTADGAAFMQQLRAGNYDSAYLAWELDADPDPYSLFHSSQTPPRGQNFVFYSNPEADQLIDRARRELNVPKRTELYRSLHALLASDQPYTWTVQVTTKWATSSRLGGVEISPGYGAFSWYPGEFNWWISRRRSRSAVNERGK
ncbi:MAG TPA: ABC transporter substrate-binding protein [Thermoanaerobaculia bacterium]|nr:ABC transporter substrate-binding protein [Thermoanaerobaculia bacterium]